MAETSISSGQLKLLQILYGQYVRREVNANGGDRGERLAWASQQTGRAIASFSDLTRREAARLIDGLQGSLGISESSPARRRPRSRQRGYEAGTAGRRASRGSASVALVSQSDLERINEALTRLGWDQQRLDAWLRSSTSPLGKRSNPAIRTQADTNRVWWALKRLLKRSGNWNEENAGPSTRAPEAGALARDDSAVDYESDEVPF